MSPLARFLPVAAAVVLVAFLFGVWAGGHPERLPSGLRDALVDENRATRAELFGTIEREYWKRVDPGELEEASLRGIVDSLDDKFSHYFTPDQAERLRDSLSGSFEGVGMSVDKAKDGLRVVGVFKGSPAERARIREGDVISEVDGESIAGEPPDLATAKIKGPAGTTVDLRVLERGGDRDRDVTVRRERIDVPVTRSRIERRDGLKTGVIQVATFSEGVHGRVSDAIRRLRRQEVDGIVLDLRNNGGGLLTEAVLTASLFLDGGEIVTTRGRAQPETNYGAVGVPVDTETPMVVLVNGATASAAEIVAGALRDRGRAAVVGRETFGKGVFQEVFPFSNGGAVNLTVGSYYLPKGDNLADDGIDPRVRAADDPDTRRDEALPQALEALARRIR